MYGDFCTLGCETVLFSLHHTKYILVWIIFFIPHSQLHSFVAASIGLITWSDHAPIILKYNIMDSPHSSIRTLRLNESLFRNLPFFADVLKEIAWYFQVNDTPGCDPGVVWEAHKSVIQGVSCNQTWGPNEAGKGGATIFLTCRYPTLRSS